MRTLAIGESSAITSSTVVDVVWESISASAANKFSQFVIHCFTFKIAVICIFLMALLHALSSGNTCDDHQTENLSHVSVDSLIDLKSIDILMNLSFEMYLW